MQIQRSWTWSFCWVLFTLLACGGGGGGTNPPAPVAPAITMQPSSSTVNQGQIASFTVAASGSAPLSYQWKKDGTALPGSSSAMLSIASTQPSDAGSYSVVVTNSAGSATSNAATLTVNPLPVIQSFTASPGPIAIGGSGVLAWTVTGATSLSVDKSVGTLDTPTGTRNVTPTATTTYTLTATNTAGSVTATATLAVDTTPFQITSFIATPAVVPFGSSSTLSWAYAGLPLNLTLDGASVAGFSAPVSPVRRQTYLLAGSNGAGSDSRSLWVAARGLDLLAGDVNQQGSTNGTGSGARFYDPCGVSADSAGNVYVADSNNHAIRKMTTAGVVTTLAGSLFQPGSTDGTGSGARFNWPRALTVDSVGNVYVADTGNHTIRKVTTEGVVTTLAGSPGVSGSADGTGSSAYFNLPNGVTVDSIGNVYVADSGNHSIRKVTTAGEVTTLAGSSGIIGSADGTGSGARFNWPYGVTVDSVGNLYVTDTENCTIRKVTPEGVVTTLAGSPGVSGSADGTGTGARFAWPWGGTMDLDGNFCVADSGNHTIRKVTPAGVVTTLAGQTGQRGFVAGLLPGYLISPYGITLTPQGDLVVTCFQGIIHITAP